jgi:hypothetical protein
VQLGTTVQLVGTVNSMSEPTHFSTPVKDAVDPKHTAGTHALPEGMNPELQ